MIDLHSHILPGLDDGTRTVEEAREVARRAVADGVTAMAATPHVRGDYPTTAEQMERGVAELREDFAREQISLEVLHGGELDLERMEHLDADELGRFSLAQGKRYLLIEFPDYGWPFALEATAYSLAARGLTPIFAHPERNSEVQARPEIVAALVDAGGAIQVTAATLDGRLGRASRGAAKQLLELGLVHMIASDAHTPQIREAGLAAAAATVGDPGLARYLTLDAPAAVVAGERLPSAPRAAKRRKWALGR